MDLISKAAGFLITGEWSGSPRDPSTRSHPKIQCLGDIGIKNSLFFHAYQLTSIYLTLQTRRLNDIPEARKEVDFGIFQYFFRLFFLWQSSGLIVFLLVFGLSGGGLFAKPTPDPFKPSIGHDISNQVTRGGSCKLELKGIAMPGETVEFKIKKKPKHGTLEGPQRIGRESIAYIYHHNGKKGDDADRVEFGLKTGSDNAWGSLTARISIVPQPPQLVVENALLDFGAVRIGGQASKILKIHNAGAGVISGRVNVYAPWALAQDPSFELREGGQPFEIRVNFAPATPGEISGRLELESDSHPYRVDLRGEGVYRFQAAERVLIDEKTRVGFLDILNLDSKDLALHLQVPKPLLTEEKIIVPAKGSARLKMALKNEIYTQEFVQLAIADGPAICSIRVDLPPSPVKLEWESAPVYDIGPVPWRNVPERSINLKNAGAANAIVRLVLGDAGLRLPPSQTDSFEIPAGEKATVKVLWSLPEIPGEAKTKIAAVQGGFATELGLVAQVLPASAAPPPVVNDKKNPMPSTSAPREQAFRVLSKAEQKEFQLRMPADISYRLVAEDGAAIAIVSWNYRGPKPAKFHLERKVMERASLDPGKVFEKRLEVPEQLPNEPVVEKWRRIGDSQAAIECVDGTAWLGRVPDLTSGFHAIRLVVLTDGENQINIKEFPVEVGVLPRPEWMNWMLAGLFLVALYILRTRVLKCFGWGGGN